jgi:pilus assembly protein CpaB
VARLSPGTLAVTVFAILLGLAGAFVVRQQLQKPEALALMPTTRPKVQAILVPIAAGEINSGHEMALNDIVMRSYTPEEFAKSEYRNKAYMPNTTQIIGRTLRQMVKPGDVFSPDMFYSDGHGPGIADLLKPGYRAVTVPVENIGAVMGFARPGSFVDVLFRSEASGKRPEITLTLLDMIEVLAIDKTIEPGRIVTLGQNSTSKGTVTLAVTPPQAKALKVIEGRGQLSLSLRNPDDPANIIPVSKTNQRLVLNDILGLPDDAEPQQMEVYKAGQKSVVVFESKTRVDVRDEILPGFISTPVAGNPDAPEIEPVSVQRVISIPDSRAGGS